MVSTRAGLSPPLTRTTYVGALDDLHSRQDEARRSTVSTRARLKTCRSSPARHLCWRARPNSVWHTVSTRGWLKPARSHGLHSRRTDAAASRRAPPTSARFGGLHSRQAQAYRFDGLHSRPTYVGAFDGLHSRQRRHPAAGPNSVWHMVSTRTPPTPARQAKLCLAHGLHSQWDKTHRFDGLHSRATYIGALGQTEYWRTFAPDWRDNPYCAIITFPTAVPEPLG